MSPSSHFSCSFLLTLNTPHRIFPSVQSPLYRKICPRTLPVRNSPLLCFSLYLSCEFSLPFYRVYLVVYYRPCYSLWVVWLTLPFSPELRPPYHSVGIPLCTWYSKFRSPLSLNYHCTHKESVPVFGSSCSRTNQVKYINLPRGSNGLMWIKKTK